MIEMDLFVFFLSKTKAEEVQGHLSFASGFFTAKALRL